MSRERYTLIVLLTCLLLFGLATQVSAQQSAPDGRRAAAQPSAKPDDLELIRLVLPDAAEDDAGNTTARKTIDMRDLFDNSEPGHYEGRIKLESFITLPLRNGVRQDLCLLLKLTSEDGLFTWGELNVLALVRLEPRPRLLDTVEVQADRFAELWSEHSMIEIGPRKDAVVIANSHFNSSQGYLELTLVSAERDRLTAVFDRTGIVRANTCGDTFEETPDITPLKQGRGDHYPLRLSIKFQLGPDDESCPPPRHRRAVTRYYQALLIWQPKRREYVIRGHALDPLLKYESAF